MAKIKDFIISRVRVKLLKIFLSQPKEMFYVRQLTRDTSEEINAVRRELARLQKTGLVKNEHRGNRLYYYSNPSYQFFPDLLGMVVKSTGLGRQIIKNRPKLGFVKYAFISQKLVLGSPRNADDLDLMLIGQIILPQLTTIVKKVETELGIEINYSSMTEEEFIYRKNRRDPFITQVLLQPRIMLLGDEIKMAS